jgi:catechol 2,3-dioxygenase-like lactoylglutathione lyase family enzyme
MTFLSFSFLLLSLLSYGKELAEMKPTTGLAQRLVPALLVRDMKITLAFYEKLGFRMTGCYPRTAPTWAEVTRDSVVFQFHTQPPEGTPTSPVCSGTFYLYPDSVDALADEYRGKVEFAWGPEVMDYGMREFGVQDPNGYFIAFCEPAS